MNVYVRMVYRNLRANLDRASLFFELIFPLFFIYVQGPAIGGLGVEVPVGGMNISYPAFLAAGAVTLTVINGGTNAGTQLWFDRKNGMFEQILMGPFTRAQYILSIIFATLIIGVVGSLLVFGLAFPVLHVSITLTLGGQLFVAAALFFGTIFFGSFAIALSVALKSSETFQVVSTFAFFIFLFTSSVFFPASSAPAAIQAVSLANPLTYTTDVFRAGIFGTLTTSASLELLVLAIEAVVMFTIAVIAFRRIRV